MITSNSVLLVTFCRQKTFVTVVDDDECGHDFLSSDCLFFGCDLFLFHFSSWSSSWFYTLEVMVVLSRLGFLGFVFFFSFFLF